MSAPVLETSSLSKFYGSTRGIEGLDLTIEEGAIFGFLGPNGAGKTTLIRTVLNLIRPTGGSASVFGLDTQADTLEIRARVGYLPGELRMDERLGVRDQLEFLAKLRGGVAPPAIEELAKRFDLRLDRRLGELSRGNKQKVGVVQAFMHEPDLLILDEPSSGLDPLRRHELETLMRERTAAGATVLLSSHVLHEVEGVADQVAIVRAGRLVASSSMAEVRNRATRRVEAVLGAPADPSGFESIPNVAGVAVNGVNVTLMVEGSVDAVVKALAGHEVLSLTSHEPDLEDVFLSYYEDGEGE